MVLPGTAEACSRLVEEAGLAVNDAGDREAAQQLERILSVAVVSAERATANSTALVLGSVGESENAEIAELRG